MLGGPVQRMSLTKQRKCQKGAVASISSYLQVATCTCFQFLSVFNFTSRPGYNSNSSSSDEFDGEMTFITEFGGEERETQPIGSSRPLTDQGSSHSVERHRGERMSDYSRQRSSHSRRRSRSRSRFGIGLHGSDHR